MPSPCVNTIPEYTCPDCVAEEGGRIRAVVVIDPNQTDNWVDITDPNEWAQKDSDGVAWIIPATGGSYDGGAPTVVDGRGDSIERTTGNVRTLEFNVQWTCELWAFFNALGKNTGKSFYFVTGDSSTGHINFIGQGKTVSFTVKDPVDAAIGTGRSFMVTAKWDNVDLPECFARPIEIFDSCEQLALYKEANPHV